MELYIGPKGHKRESGRIGMLGKDGDQGLPGPSGQKGGPGRTGLPGKDGDKGMTGPPRSESPKGQNGPLVSLEELVNQEQIVRLVNKGYKASKE